MRPVLFVLLLALFLLSVAPSSSLAAAVKKASGGDSGGGKALYCALCEVVVDEVNAAIDRTADEHGHFVQTKWRIDEKRRIPFARTEHRVMEIIEQEVTPSLPLYGSTNHTGRTRLIRKPGAPPLPTAPLIPHDSEGEGEGVGEGSDVDYSPSEFTHSRLLTETLTSLYERMVDVHLEEMALLFHRAEEQVKEKLCIQKVKACSKGTSFEPFHPPTRQRSTTAPLNPSPPSPPEESEAAQAEAQSQGGAGEQDAATVHSEL